MIPPQHTNTTQYFMQNDVLYVYNPYWTLFIAEKPQAYEMFKTLTFFLGVENTF